MIKRIRAVFAACFVAGTIFAGAPASAVPAVCVMPTSGTVSGLTLVQDINNCYGAALGLFAGGSAPGSPTNGMLWWNTGTGYIQQWDGTAWINLWFVDTTNHLVAPQVGGGAPPNVASAATTDLCATQSAFLFLTGSTTITSFGTSCPVGIWKRLFVNTGAGPSPTLQYNGSTLVLPGGGNIATAPGDTFDAVYSGSSQWIVTNYQRATGAALSTVGLNVGAAALGASALAGFQQPVNLQINTSVASNQLTVAIKGVNGADPSTGNPVLVGFRPQTGQPNGLNISGALTGALSFTLAATSSMGCTTAVACRLWVTLICQTETSGTCNSTGGGSGAILVGLSNQSTATQVFPLGDERLQTTGAGMAGDIYAGIIQTSVASLSGKAVVIIGYIEATWTAGTGWAAPTKVQLFGPGVHKPGDVVQLVYAQTASGVSTGASFAASNITASITPTSVINQIEVSVTGNFEAASAADITAQIRRGASTNVGESFVFGSTTSGTLTNGGLPFDIFDAPATTSATSYTLYFNSSTGASVVPAGHIFLREIMGALDSPAANDDAGDLPPRALAAKRDYARNRASQPDRARQEAAA